MKKLLLTLFALIVTMSLSAQTNLAKDCDAIATSGAAGNAVDGSTGTRWESAQGVDPQIWQVDLGEAKTFNTISIIWEGAYASSFTIEAGNEVDGEGFLTGGTELVNISGQALTGFPYVQNFQFTAFTGRYIKFTGTARGSAYGYSFWEFGVYNLTEDLSLTTLTISASGNQTIVGGTINFTATGKDQLDGTIDTGALTWQSSNPTVGTVENGVFTALASGTTAITAKSGSVTSNEVNLTVTSGTKIDLSTNWQYRIYPLGDDIDTGSLVGAFDDNDGSLWAMHKETAADESARTYEVGFIADLGAVYDINNISIHFEGACSEAFTLSFAGNDGVFGGAVYSGGKTGINNHTEEFSGESVTGARYVKFLSTKASTQWGVKIYDFSVVGTKTADVTFAAPTITDGTVSSTTDESITFSLSATNANSGYVMYELAANGIAAQYHMGETGKASTITIGGLAAGTTYNFAIFAINANGDRSAIKELSAKTTGDVFVLTAAPAPTQDAANVMSIYSNTYTPATTYNYGSWSQSTVVATESVEGNELLKLTNYNYLGFEYATQLDLSEMTHLHIDILPMQAMSFGITPILVAGNPTENSQSVGTLTVKEWNSIDIPLSQFGMDFTNLSHQLKIDKGTGSEVVYVDNIYFYKAGDTPVEPEATSGEGSATIESTVAEVNGKELKYTWAFTQSNMDVTVTFACTNKDEILGMTDGYVHDKSNGFVESAGLTKTWTNCTKGQKLIAAHKWEFAGGAYITPDFTYTVQDGGDTPVDPFVLTPAPAPTQDAANVMSIYSDTYTPATTYVYGQWNQSTAVAEETVENNNMLKLTTYNYLGFEYATDLDISEMTYIHIDVLPMQTMSLGITPIMRGGTPTEKSTSVGTLNVKEWNSIDLPLSDFGFDITYKTFQLKIDMGTGVETVYVDNIYFYKAGDTPVEPEATSGDGSYTIPSGMNEGKELKYTWAFTQSNMDVTVTFANVSTDEIVGIVDGYVFDKSDGFEEHEGLSYTWTNCTEGQKLVAAHKWMFAEGDFVTPDFTYTVTAAQDTPTEPVVKTVQLLGDWNWKPEVDNITLTKGEGNVWTGTLDLTDAVGTQEFKLCINGGGDQSDNWAGWIGTNKVTVQAPNNWGDFTGSTDNQNMKLYHGTTGYKTYTITATWTESENYGEGWTLKIEGKDKADLFVKFVNGKKWENVYAYTWNVLTVSWPGYKIEKTGTETFNGVEYDVYTWNVPAEATGVPEIVIFNDGTGGTAGESQTANLEYVNGKTYTDMVPAAPAVYSIVGELTGGWDADADMTQDATNPNIYTLEVKGFEATAQGYQYKLRKNHKWGEGEVPASGNYTWNPEEVPATYDLTFTFNLSEGTLTLDPVKQVTPQPIQYSFDFNNLPEGTPLSSSESNAGDITTEMEITDGSITMTISPATEGTPNRFWGTANGPQLRLYSGTLSFKAAEGMTLMGLAFMYGKWNAGNTASYGSLSDVVPIQTAAWTIEETDPTQQDCPPVLLSAPRPVSTQLVVTIANNTQLNSITYIAAKDELVESLLALSALCKEAETLLMEAEAGTAKDALQDADDKAQALSLSAIETNDKSTPHADVTNDQLLNEIAALQQAINDYKTATGIRSIENGQLTIGNYYTLDGRKLNGKPTQKGVYVINGRKVAIK